jgi:hypothetical protein
MDNTDNIPKFFYKYRSMADDEAIGRIERTILYNEVYFSTAKSFNDPFDLRPIFSFKASRGARLIKYKEVAEQQTHLNRAQKRSRVKELVREKNSEGEIDLTEYMQRKLTSEIGLYCISEKNDDILMWSHYADSHRGICIEFSRKSQLTANALKVIYSTERVPINPFIDNSDEMADRSLLTKSYQWSYEMEWRLIRHDKGAGVMKFLNSDITGIIIGAMMSEQKINIVKNWISKRTTPITLYSSNINKKTFSLDIIRCE